MKTNGLSPRWQLAWWNPTLQLLHWSGLHWVQIDLVLKQLDQLSVFNMYRKLVNVSVCGPLCPPIRRMVRGWICPQTTCREGPHLISLPAALPLAPCHILKWIETAEMSLSLSFSPSSLTVSTWEDDNAAMPSNLVIRILTMTKLLCPTLL